MNRKKLFLGITTAVAASYSAAQEGRQPNVLIIMADQLRADLVQREGYPLNTMPFTDSLAQTGIWFSRAYTAAPASGPARAAMLTGRFPSSVRVRSNHTIHDAFFDKDMFDIARQQGYKTALIGKNHSYITSQKTDHWSIFDHLGQQSANKSEQAAAFDKFLASTDFYAHFSPSPFGVEAQLPYRMTDDAIKWIGSLKEKNNPRKSANYDNRGLFQGLLSLMPTNKRMNVCEVVPFVYAYARSCKNRGEAYRRIYRNIAKLLVAYEKDRGIKLLSNSFVDSVAEDFIDFLKDKNLFLNTIATYYSKVCFMFRKMDKRGYDVDWSFEDVAIGVEDVVTVSISMTEIEKIYNLPVKKGERMIVKDMFVANCLIGMRFGDFISLTNTNIQGDSIVRKTQKTGEVVQVPIHPIVREILNKYGGFPPYDKSKQNYNKIVKNVCRQAGITDKVLWERTVGHKIIRKSFKRYELISSHTARRSFATNAYLAGIPPARIMLITGHKTEQAFFGYVRISKSENAKELAEHPFFNHPK